MFVRFVDDIPPDVYTTHMVLNPKDQRFFKRSLFRIRDRCALINILIGEDVEAGGCGIKVDKLKGDVYFGEHIAI